MTRPESPVAIEGDLLKRLDRAFNPRTVAVVGDKRAMGYFWLRAMNTFQGKLYSVQIDPKEIVGIQQMGVPNYASLADIPDEVDYVVPGPFDCHVSGWIRVCDRIADLDVETIVPGHGPIGTKKELREMRDYLSLLRRESRRSFQAGEPSEEAARKLKVGGFYTRWANPERLPMLVDRLYMEFRGEM